MHIIKTYIYFAEPQYIYIMSKTLIICHIVFCTKFREKSINPEYDRDLYAFICQIFKENKCWVHRINGASDHIHILLNLNPTIALADLMREVKASSSQWLKKNPDFRFFRGWGKGYFAVSVNPDNIEHVKQYIINQKDHHRSGGFEKEIEFLINHFGLDWFPDEWN